MNKALLVARHEFLVTAANKAFVAITLLGPVLILAVSVLPGLAATRGFSSGSTVALVGGEDGLRSALAAVLVEAKSSLVPAADEGEARRGVLEGRYAAALILPPGWERAENVILFAKTGTDYMLYSRIQGVVEAVSRQARAAASGVDPAVLAAVLKSPGLDMRRLRGEESVTGSKGGRGLPDEYLGILLTVLAFVMLMYMTVLLYGQLIGRSVLQEKTSKTVEIMLSSVSSRELLIGKILGPGAAGLIQYAFWILMTLGASSLAGPALGIAMPAVLTPANLGWLVVFFIPAYFLYAAAYAALGAGAEDEQHLQQLAWPILIFMMIPMVMINMFVTSPDSILSVILSYFPLTSPIVMLIRVLVARPAWWELALSYIILLAAVIGMAFLAAKVFRIGILMTGKRRKLSEIFRWASFQ
jgi:ABC-2 type transport system permease protein